MTYHYICPKCTKPLTKIGNSYVCEDNHSYDIAKSGYVNLVLANQKNSADAGDNKEMIAARLSVMDSGYYKKLADDLIDIIKDNKNNFIADAGCGVGYLPYRLANYFSGSNIVGLDISKNAILAASKKYKNISFAVASSVRLPLPSDSVDTLICAFAPVFPIEFARVLNKEGLFLRVVPSKKHLFALKELLYQTPYENELDPLEIEGFCYEKTVESKSTISAEGKLLHSIVKMTPYYYHSNKSDIESLLNINSATVNLEFDIRIYRKI